MPARTITLHSGRQVRTNGFVACSRGRLAAEAAFRPRPVRRATPAELCNSSGVAMQMDYNDVAGDCTDACLANVLDVVAAILKYAGSTIPAANVKSWAIAQGFYDGANIPDVLTALQTVPMIDANGQGRIIGAFAGVDYTNLPAVYDALSDCYALDLGVNSSYYQGFVGNGIVSVGPLQTRAINSAAELDHSIPAFDFGSAEYLATQYHDFYGAAVDLSPISSGPQTPCIGIETWASLCIVPAVSFQNTTGEAHVIESFPPPGTTPPAVVAAPAQRQAHAAAAGPFAAGAPVLRARPAAGPGASPGGRDHLCGLNTEN